MKTRFANFVDEYGAARRRIGRSTAKTLRWMLAFTQRDIAALTEREWMSLRYEVYAISDSIRVPGFGLPGLSSLRASWTDQSNEAPLPTQEQVLTIQNKTKGFFESFVETGRLGIPEQQIQFSVSRGSQLHERAQLWVHCEHPIFAWQLTVIDLLSRHGGYLRRCRECRQLFHARRRTQWYHSRICGNRVSQREWRKRQAAERVRHKQLGKEAFRKKRHRISTQPSKGGNHERQHPITNHKRRLKAL